MPGCGYRLPAGLLYRMIRGRSRRGAPAGPRPAAVRRPCRRRAGFTRRMTAAPRLAPIFRVALWMVGTFTSLLSMAVAGRELAAEITIFQLLFWRGVVGLAVILLLFQVTGGWRHLRTQKIRHPRRAERGASRRAIRLVLRHRLYPARRGLRAGIYDADLDPDPGGADPGREDHGRAGRGGHPRLRRGADHSAAWHLAGRPAAGRGPAVGIGLRLLDLCDDPAADAHRHAADDAVLDGGDPDAAGAVRRPRCLESGPTAGAGAGSRWSASAA